MSSKVWCHVDCLPTFWGNLVPPLSVSKGVWPQAWRCWVLWNVGNHQFNRSQESKTVSFCRWLYEMTHCHISEDLNLHQHHCDETLISGNNERPSEIPLCMVCNHTITPFSHTYCVFCQCYVHLWKMFAYCRLSRLKVFQNILKNVFCCPVCT